MSPDERRAHLLAFLDSLPGASNTVEALDSMGMLHLALYLEDTYGIRLAEHRIDAADLKSVEGLLSVIERHAS